MLALQQKKRGKNYLMLCFRFSEKNTAAVHQTLLPYIHNNLFKTQKGSIYTMKMPNGYGSVIKLSGKRRKPWAIRISKRQISSQYMEKLRNRFPPSL